MWYDLGPAAQFNKGGFFLIHVLCEAVQQIHMNCIAYCFTIAFEWDLHEEIRCFITYNGGFKRDIE